jgi:hypothetical protein
MPETPQDLLARAARYTPTSPEARDCWDFVMKGIKVGWLDDEELRDLLGHLRAGRDFGVEELLFAHIGDQLRVSFLDDRATCSPAALLTALTALASD